jgi:hypothetical protein
MGKDDLTRLLIMTIFKSIWIELLNFIPTLSKTWLTFCNN